MYGARESFIGGDTVVTGQLILRGPDIIGLGGQQSSP